MNIYYQSSYTEIHCKNCKHFKVFKEENNIYYLCLLDLDLGCPEEYKSNCLCCRLCEFNNQCKRDFIEEYKKKYKGV